MPCCGLIPDEVQSGVCSEVLTRNPLTQICFNTEELGLPKRLGIFVGTVASALMAAAILTMNEAESVAFCACLHGEDHPTDIKPQCTTSDGSVLYSCPASCTDLSSSYNWREEWKTINEEYSDYCKAGETSGTYTCEPTVACCAAWMKQINTEYSPSFVDPTVEENKSWSCPNFMLKVLVTAIVSTLFNQICGKPIVIFLFKQSSKCAFYGAVSIIVFQCLCVLVWVPMSATSQTAYGDNTGVMTILVDFGLAYSLELICTGNLVVIAKYGVAKAMGAKAAS